ncbi:hypothetical protein CI238_00250 [Colletotrichum incanum]|uniref:Uncharacterized protein n=1 Tax=Colletotrichum incanum TaxID=1573173 RepID=A0A161Y8Y6_COLIC|nr:hypothetical protein CI238_00250 [Colletotrichum incanum]
MAYVQNAIANQDLNETTEAAYGIRLYFPKTDYGTIVITTRSLTMLILMRLRNDLTAFCLLSRQLESTLTKCLRPALSTSNCITNYGCNYKDRGQGLDSERSIWLQNITKDKFNFNATIRVLCEYGLVEADHPIKESGVDS